MWPEILSTNWGLRYVEANNYTRFFNGGTTSDVLDNRLAHFAGSSNATTGLFVVWAVGNDVGQERPRNDPLVEDPGGGRKSR